MHQFRPAAAVSCLCSCHVPQAFEGTHDDRICGLPERKPKLRVESPKRKVRHA